MIESYEGNWINGYQTGKGKLTLHTVGKIYEGDFTNGRFDGEGTYSSNDGSYYTGGFKNGTENGYGKQFDKGKKLVREETRKDGEFIGK